MFKKALFVVPVVLGLCAFGASADEVRDWQDIRDVHVSLQEALRAMHRAQEANHYDMGGHAAKAEELIRQAERELRESIESRRKDRDHDHH